MEFRERFDREARVIFERPDICPAYDVGTYDGAAYRVMRYLEGRSTRGWKEEG